MKIYHIERDFNLTYTQWIKYIKANYKNVVLIQSAGRGLYVVFAD